MASLSTCHLELFVWDGNLVKSILWEVKFSKKMMGLVEELSTDYSSRTWWLCGRASGFRSNGPGFKTTSAVSKLGQVRLPHFACVFRKRVKAVGPFYLVSMPGEVKDPKQGNGKKPVVDSQSW